jgi:hypothetical protein
LGFPMSGQQFVDLGDLDGRQASQHVGEIFMGVQTPPPAAAQDRANHRAAPSGIGVAYEKPALSTHCRRANVVLDQRMPTCQAGRSRSVSLADSMTTRADGASLFDDPLPGISSR